MKNMLLAILGLTCSLAVLADTPEANIKKLLQPRMGDTAVIESVIKTPYNNLYEVKIGNELVYTDAEAKFIFIGRLIDAESSKDITQVRLDEMRAIGQDPARARAHMLNTSMIASVRRAAEIA